MIRRQPTDAMPPPWHDPTGWAWMVYCRDVLGEQLARRKREYLQAVRRALGLLRQPKKVLIEDVGSTHQIPYVEAERWRSGGATVSMSGAVMTATVAKPWYVWPGDKSFGVRKNLRWWTLTAAASQFHDSRLDRRSEWPLADKVLSSPLDFVGMTDPQSNFFCLCASFITSVSGAVGTLRLPHAAGEISEWVKAGRGTEVLVPVDWDEEVAHSGKELWGGWRHRLIRRGVQ